MNKRFLKRLLIGSGAVVAVLALVLVVHIYLVTRRTPPDAQTVAMARLDFRQTLSNTDAKAITDWLYSQPGVDHVLCTADAQIAVFTFFPVKTDADGIVTRMRKETRYDVTRFTPDEKQMANGCPVAKTSLTYKLYSLFN